MTAPELLLVTGSRSLAAKPDSESWGRRVIVEAIDSLPPDSLVVTGDARYFDKTRKMWLDSLDTWAFRIAKSRGYSVRMYNLSGYVRIGGGDVIELLQLGAGLFLPRQQAKW